MTQQTMDMNYEAYDRQLDNLIKMSEVLAISPVLTIPCGIRATSLCTRRDKQDALGERPLG